MFNIKCPIKKKFVLKHQNSVEPQKMYLFDKLQLQVITNFKWNVVIMGHLNKSLPWNKIILTTQWFQFFQLKRHFGPPRNILFVLAPGFYGGV